MAFTSRGMVRLFLFLAGYVLFLILGALVFTAIEGPEERQQVQGLRNVRVKFLNDHPCVKGEYTVKHRFWGEYFCDTV